MWWCKDMYMDFLCVSSQGLGKIAGKCWEKHQFLFFQGQYSIDYNCKRSLSPSYQKCPSSKKPTDLLSCYRSRCFMDVSPFVGGVAQRPWDVFFLSHRQYGCKFPTHGWLEESKLWWQYGTWAWDILWSQRLIVLCRSWYRFKFFFLAFGLLLVCIIMHSSCGVEGSLCNQESFRVAKKCIANVVYSICQHAVEPSYHEKQVQVFFFEVFWKHCYHKSNL